MIHRVYTDISESVFYNFIRRAKLEGAFVSKDPKTGKDKIDIGSLLGLLIETYADGNYTIVPKKKKEIKGKSKIEGFPLEKE